MDVKGFGNTVKFLAVSLYTEMSEEDKEMLGKDLREVLESVPEKQVKKIEVIYQYLQDSAKIIQNSTIFQKFQENEIFQNALQKLDSQIREHTKKEIQLKLESEELAGKLSEPKKNSENVGEKIDSLLGEREKLIELNRIKNKELEKLRICDSGRDWIELRMLRENALSEVEKIKKSQKKCEKLKKFWKTEKKELNNLREEYERDKEFFFKLKSQAGLNSEIKLLNIESNQNKFCRSFRKGRINKDLTPILPIDVGKIEKLVNLSQSVKRTKNPLGVKSLRPSTTKLKTKIRLNMYTSKK